MKIFKSLSLLAGLAFITANVLAQTQTANRQPQQMAQKMTDRVKQNVTGITPDQEKQILAAEQDFATACKLPTITIRATAMPCRAKKNL